jgi:hypothetical protein
MNDISHRPLPAEPGLASLPEDDRKAVAQSWRRRARNELSTSTVFASLTRALVAFGAPRQIIQQAANAVPDEVRHAEICMHVARAYWPDCPDVEPAPVVEAPFETEPSVNALLYVVMQSCINEGVATVYLQRSIDEAEHPLARAAVRDILTDEIHHARFGWTLLASDAMRAEWRKPIAEALPTLLERVADAWIEQLTGTGGVPKGHGTISADQGRVVLRDAYDQLILPGFDVVGIDSEPGRKWVERRARGQVGL